MDIEEDIKIVQEFTELDRKLRNYKVESDYDNFCERRCVAIDHILAEREEDKKKIEELEEKNQHLSSVSDYETISLQNNFLEEQLELANSQIEELEEEKKVQIHQTMEVFDRDYIHKDKIKEDYIPKQKVEEEIEALRKMFKATMEGKLQEYTPGEIIIKRNTLKELLEE